MTQEQKDKMEQEVRAYTIPYIRNHGQRMGDIVKQDFTSIYQNILDYPSEWGLTSMVVVRQLEMETNIQHKEKTELQSQLTKYREALEAIATRWNKVAEHNEMRTALHLIQQDVFDALKQQDDDPRPHR